MMPVDKMMRVEMCVQVLPVALLCSIKPTALATPAGRKDCV
jgi:hypothetical protein